ncbi:hypothetical protein C0J52_23578, partial [Blattella germanica]
PSTLRNNYLQISYEKVLDEIRHELGNYNIWTCVDETSDSLGRYVANLVVGKLSEDGPGVLWPTNLNKERVFLLLSDAAPYMIKPGKQLRYFIPMLSILHVLPMQCIVLRKQYAPARVATYRDMLPDVALPPQPIITSWGTWLHAAIFYCDNFHAVKMVVDSFVASDAACIKDAQIAFNDKTVQQDLIYIKSNFG